MRPGRPRQPVASTYLVLKIRSALPPNWVIVAHYYDVESGRKDLDLRGRGTGHEQFDIPIPRDGGIQDLLTAAKSTARPFVAVICESIERVARRTYFGTKIEYELEQAGVTLCAADEPISAEPGCAPRHPDADPTGQAGRRRVVRAADARAVFRGHDRAHPAGLEQSASRPMATTQRRSRTRSRPNAPKAAPSTA